MSRIQLSMWLSAFAFLCAFLAGPASAQFQMQKKGCCMPMCCQGGMSNPGMRMPMQFNQAGGMRTPYGNNFRPQTPYGGGMQAGGFQNPMMQMGGFQNPMMQMGGFQNPMMQNGGFQNPMMQNGNFQNPLLQNPGFQNPWMQNANFQNPLAQANGAFPNQNQIPWQMLQGQNINQVAIPATR